MVCVSAPEHLSAAARAVWDATVAAHPAPDRIVGPDLEAYCTQVARMRDAQARVDAEGMIVADAPQWSPVVTTGTTVVAGGDVVVGEAAAMEPRRDDGDDHHHAGACRPSCTAAMEPRRDDGDDRSAGPAW